MSPRKCQTFDIPSTTSELTTNKTNPDYSRRKSMPADMHHREGESTAGPQTNMVDTVVGARSNIADTAVGAAPLFYKRSELIKDVRHVDDDDDDAQSMSGLATTSWFDRFRFKGSSAAPRKC